MSLTFEWDANKASRNAKARRFFRGGQHGFWRRAFACRSNRLLRQFASGILWVTIWAALASLATSMPFWVVFATMLALALGGGAIALFWIARWAERDAPGGQFGIASLFLMMAYVGVFFSCVRWSLVATRNARMQLYPSDYAIVSLEPTVLEFALASLGALVLLIVSLPFLLGLLDSVMWCAVWLVKRRVIKRVVVRTRRPRDPA